MITLEEALGIPTTKTSPIQTPLAPTPPDKIDILIDLMDEVKRLKQIRSEVVEGERKADEILKAEMYITQLTLSAYKIVLDSLKESAKILLTQNNQTNIESVKIDVKAMLAEYNKLLTPNRVEDKPISSNSTA